MTAAVAVDVAILGGGPAGAAAALALRQRGRSVALIERTHHDEWRPGELLSPRVRDPLQTLGLWHHFNNHLTPAPAPTIQVSWGSDEPYDRSSIFDAWGHGWTVDRRRFDSMLVDAAEAAGAHVLRGVPHVTIQGQPGAWQLNNITAPTFLDATGRTARIARTQGAEWRVHDRLCGIVTRIIPTTPPPPVLTIEAAEHGWWYSAPLPDGTIVIAFMTDADQWTGDAAPFFKANLAATTITRTRLDNAPISAPLHVRPAGSGRLLPAAAPGWQAIGDAAATWDPLSGDGIFRALRAGITAADRLTDNISTPPEHHTFEQYLDARATHYRREQRWPDSPFWRRRHAPIPSKTPLTLDPTTRLRWHGAPPTDAEALLAPSELTTLCSLCDPSAGNTAADIVRAFRAVAPHYRDDERAILALQHLQSTGVLTTGGPPNN